MKQSDSTYFLGLDDRLTTYTCVGRDIRVLEDDKIMLAVPWLPTFSTLSVTRSPAA